MSYHMILKTIEACQRFDEAVWKVIELCESAGLECEDLKKSQRENELALLQAQAVVAWTLV